METTINHKDAKYSLKSVTNYKSELHSSIQDINANLSKLLIEYFKFIVESVKFRKKIFARYIIIRGLDTIINVFNHLLLYTKNLELTYFHCQKAFYFYVEFISQITEDDKMFLQLSSRDATMYVYKKSIFEITNEVRIKNEILTEETRNKFNKINIYVDIYKSSLLKLINNDFCSQELLQNVINMHELLCNTYTIENINIFGEIFEKLFYTIQTPSLFYNISILLLKRIVKKPTILEKCNENLKLFDIHEHIESPDKFINTILS